MFKTKERDIDKVNMKKLIISDRAAAEAKKE